MRAAWREKTVEGEEWEMVLLPTPRRARSQLCKAGKHDLCIGTFQSIDRDPVAHRVRGILRCICGCHGSAPE